MPMNFTRFIVSNWTKAMTNNTDNVVSFHNPHVSLSSYDLLAMRRAAFRLPNSFVCVMLFASITILIGIAKVYLSLNDNVLQILALFILISALFYPRWVYLTMLLIAISTSAITLNISAINFRESIIVLIGLGSIAGFTSELMGQIMRHTLRVSARQKQSEMRYRLLAENVSDVIWLLSLDGEIDYVSHSVKKLLGYTPDELIALRRIVHTDESWEQWKVAFRQLRNRTVQTPYYIELEWIKHDKTTVWTESTVDHLRNAQGDVVGILGITRNIEERRALELQELTMMLEQERMRILSSFIIKASHEFRTPLSIINTRAHMMTKIDDTAQRERHASIINLQVEQIVHLVDDLNLLTKLETGFKVKKQPVHLGNFFSPDYLSESYGITRPHVLKTDVEISELVLNVEQESFITLFDKLLHNAVRYSKDQANITITVRQKDYHCYIEVRDEGYGIAEEHLSRVFERFFRVDVAHSTRGFGLGLSIAQRIVELHNGTIAIESIVDVGTTIKLKFPIGEEAL